MYIKTSPFVHYLLLMQINKMGRSRAPIIQAAAAALQLLQLLWLLIIMFFLISTTTGSSSSSPLNKIPRLGRLPRNIANQKLNPSFAADHVDEDLRTFYYDQTLDHFNYRPESFATFRQRYMVSFKHWRGAHAAAPIFVYLGAEESFDETIALVGLGFLTDNAPKFGALTLYIEHRFYGKSNPFDASKEQAFHQNVSSALGYFNSAQALADYAEIILHLKNNLSAEASPVVVFGASYGGMLAAWFRLKYPHIATGALASSAPLLYFDKITPSDGYYSVVTRDFREASENCYNTIKQSWSEIDRIAAQTNGLGILSQKFKTCKDFQDAEELKDYLERTYEYAAQYDNPLVNQICNNIDNATSQGNGIIDRIAYAVVIMTTGNNQCSNLSEPHHSSQEPLDIVEWLWGWQSCTEIVIPIGRGRNDTMFPAAPFDMNSFSDHCKQTYGVRPRSHWITTYFGGHHIKLTLERFGSNIIFSNGLRDPYSSGGVLESISPSLVALPTARGSHCLDIRPASKDDPKWLVAQRNREVQIIREWIIKYNRDLRTLN